MHVVQLTRKNSDRATCWRGAVTTIRWRLYGTLDREFSESAPRVAKRVAGQGAASICVLHFQRSIASARDAIEGGCESRYPSSSSDLPEGQPTCDIS
jgi:hypothetical protein